MARKLLILLIICGLLTDVHAQIAADFNSSTQTGCSPLIVNFTDISTGGPTSWLWNFGNGNTSTQQNPSAAYLNPGIYTISLIASGGGSSDTMIKVNHIQVYNDPTPDFIADQVNGCVPLTVNFTNLTVPGDHSTITYTWDFGDGSFSSAINPTHTFNSTGNFNVTLIAVDGNSCQDNINKTGYISVANKPNANFSSLNNVGCNPPHNVNFSNSSSGSSSLTYLWDFGDGNSSGATNPVNTYIAYGSYDVQLIVTDQFGCQDSITRLNEVNIIDVNANFTQSMTSGCIGETFSFTDQSTPTGISPIGWIWNFGDGNVSTLQNPVHRYNSAGTYSVSLTTTMNGCSDVRTKNNLITIFPDPVASFTNDINAVCQPPVTVNFTDASVNAVSHVYYFGDGDTSHAQSPSHTYTNYGSYIATLVVTNADGCTDTFRTSPPITVQPPVADFYADASNGCIPIPVQFYDSSQANETIVAWYWDFGDGNTDSVQDPVHIYTTQGDYAVTLVIETTSGCRDTIIYPNLIEVGQEPNVGFVALPTVSCLFTAISFNDQTDFADLWLWDFGDGGTSTSQNPTYTYSDTGFFTVSLAVSNNGCAADTIIDNYVYVSPPDALFIPTFNCTNTMEVDFTNTSIGGDVWWWAVDTGGPTWDTVYTYDLNYIFPDTGIYNVSLFMEDTASGCTDIETQSVTIVNPVANFTATPTAGCRPLIVDFTSTSTDAVSYIWNFSNGQNASSQSPTIVIGQPGYYGAHLYITDIHGCQRDINIDSIVVIAGPTTDFTTGTPVGCTPLTVDFTDMTTLFLTTSITSWSWDFGDGNTSTLQNPSNVYVANGTYNVRLTTVDDWGCTHTVTKTNYIDVTYPVAEFTADTFSCPGNPVTFGNLSNGVGNTYQWDFGDGNSSSISNPVHNYLVEGSYDVELIATDINTCADTMLKQLYIKVQLPQAKFVSDTAFSTCPPLLANFTDSSRGDIIYWEWHFGDGSMSNLENPSHIYSYADSFDVTLIVMNADSCRDTTTVEDFAIVLGPNGIFTMVPNSGCTDLPVTFNAVTQNAVNRTWDFGDGSVIVATDTITYTYTNSGLYFPSLILTDAFGCVFTVSSTDSIIAGSHNVNFTESPRHVCVPGTVNFTDLSTAFPPITGWKWYFGDGDSSSIQSPSHLYSTVGSYDITLITDNGICKDTLVKPQWIDADQGPGADFGMSSNTGCVPATISFYDSTISDSSVGTWSWSFGDGNASSMQNPSHTYTVAGTYNVQLIVLTVAGCLDTVTYSVNIYNNPNVTTSPDRVICDGDSVLIFATGGSFYNWTPGVTLTDSTNNFPRAFPTANTQYIVQVSNGFGCVTVDTVNVAVNPLPAVSAGPDFTICNFDTAQLNGSGSGVTIAWSPAASLSSTSVLNPFAYPNTSRTYTLSVTDTNNCTASDDMMVTINQLPNVSAGNDTFVCNGTSTILQGSGASLYSWSPGTYLNNPFIANPTSTPASTITYLLTGVDTNWCSNSASVTVQYVVRPNANAGPNQTICEGDTAILSATGGDGFSAILWTPGATLMDSTSRTTGAIPSLNTTYNVVVTDTFGCSDNDNVDIYVNPKPSMTVSADTFICMNDSIEVSATGGLTYNWTDNNTSCTSCQTTFVRPIATANYAVTITDVNTCTNRDTVTVVVNPLPIGVLSNDTTICDGESTYLRADSGVSYTWAPSATLSCSGCQVPLASPPSSQAYVVVIDNVYGCTTRDTVQVDVSPIPSPVISGNNVICQGDTTQLVVSGGDNYYWTPNFAIDCQTCDTINIFPQVNVSYIVEVSNIWGCTVFDSMTIETRPFPVIDAGPDRTICLGESVQMQATSNVPNNVWSPSIWLNDPSALDGIATPIDTTTFIITSTSLSNCTSHDTMRIHVIDRVRISVSPDTILCTGDSIQLSAGPIANSDNGISYSWRPGFYLDNPTIANPTSGTLQDITYMVVASSETCIPDTAYVSLDVKSLPAIDAGEDILSVSGSQVPLNPSQNSLLTYTWTPDQDLSCGVCPNPIFIADSSQTFTVSVVDQYGCIESDSVRVNVIGVCDPGMIHVANAFTPNGDGKNDIARVRTQGIHQINYFRIYDRWGQLIYETDNIYEGWNGTISGKMSNSDVFVYYVSATCSGGLSIMKTGNITLIR